MNKEMKVDYRAQMRLAFYRMLHRLRCIEQIWHLLQGDIDTIYNNLYFNKE